MLSSRSSRFRLAFSAGVCASFAIALSCAGSDPILIKGSGGAGGDIQSESDGSETTDDASDGIGVGGEGGGIGLGGAGGYTGDPCGNGKIDTGEECDDGNLTPNDGCSSCVIDCDPAGTKNPMNGHCYEVFAVATNEAMAEAACETWGGEIGLGHLVSIGDDAEQTFLTPLITQPGWIGGGDATTEGVFTWYDGTPFVYKHFALGEPNDPTHIENCIFVHADANWDDHDCAATEPSYICERRGAGTF